MQPKMIEASHLSKRFNQLKAVDSVSLSVNQGQIFGLLGPNAAGKTTLIRMLCGIISCDQGQVIIAGKPLKKAKAKFGYVAQHFGQYEELSVWENLRFYARMYGVKNKDHLNKLLDRYQLTPFKNQRAGQLSGGYQRRLALVCALAHDPQVLFLDEPTAGIDPVTRKLLWDDFYQLAIQGKTLFVTTHYMEEAQRCHQLAFITQGKLVAEGTPQKISDSLGEVKVFSAAIAYLPELHKALHAIEGLRLLNQFGDQLRLIVEPSVNRSQLSSIIQQFCPTAPELSLCQPNLEDVFIALTQNDAQKYPPKDSKKAEL